MTLAAGRLCWCFVCLFLRVLLVCVLLVSCFASVMEFLKSSVRTGEAPPERRTIHVIFADPILVAMECVPVSSSSDLK